MGARDQYAFVKLGTMEGTKGDANRVLRVMDQVIKEFKLSDVGL